jgi:hypothetical protein
LASALSATVKTDPVALSRPLALSGFAPRAVDPSDEQDDADNNDPLHSYFLLRFFRPVRAPGIRLAKKAAPDGKSAPKPRAHQKAHNSANYAEMQQPGESCRSANRNSHDPAHLIEIATLFFSLDPHAREQKIPERPETRLTESLWSPLSPSVLRHDLPPVI